MRPCTWRAFGGEFPTAKTGPSNRRVRPWAARMPIPTIESPILTNPSERVQSKPGRLNTRLETVEGPFSMGEPAFKGFPRGCSLGRSTTCFGSRR